MQSKTGKIMSPPEKIGGIKAPDDLMIPYAICFEDAPIGIAITTVDGRVVHINKSLLSMTGYNKEEASRINASHIYKNPQERERFISRLLKKEKVSKFETEFVHKGGYPILISMTSVLISLGPEDALMTMVEDITTNRLTEKELKISQQAIETSINAIAMTDLNGNLTYVNPACLRMWGYDEPSQVLGKAVLSFCHSWEEAAKALSEVQKKGSFAGELVAKRADGSSFDVQLAANIVKGKEGDPICLMSSFVDVSERKRISTALRDSERQYRMALDAMGDATTLVDKDLRIILANKIVKEWCTVLGISPNIEGLSLFDAFPFTHEDNVREEYQSVFDTSETITTQESFIINGKEILTETRKSPVYEEGRVVRVLAAMRDITEKSRLEKAFFESEKKYRNIFENTLVGIYQSTLEGRYFSANPAIAKMYGYETPETFMAGITSIGNQLYVDPADRERCMQVLKESERLESFEVQTRRRDGSLMWNLINSRPVRDIDGKVQYIEGVIIDTTKLKQTEAALRSSQERFSKAFHSSPAPMAISTLDDGLFIDVNGRFLDMLEYNREELIGRTSEELGILENHEQRRFEVKWLQQNGSIREKPVRFKTKKGGYRDVLWSAEIITIDGNQYMLSLIYNITEHKKTEQELRESQQRLADIIDFLPDATLVIDRSGKVIAWNRAIEEMTGVSAKEMLGKIDYEYAVPFYGERRPILIDLALHVNPEREKNYTAINRNGDTIFGESFVPNLPTGHAHLSATASVLRDAKGEVVAAIECIRNNTERRRADEALQESEERFKRAFYISPDAININRFDDGLFVDINEGFTKLTGYTREDVIGKTALEIAIWCDLENRKKLIQELKDSGYYENLEADFRRKNGSVGRGLMSARVILLQGITHIISITRDITERKRAEEERRRLEERLQRAEKMEALGIMAGGVAHDLNNVMGILVGYSELLLDDIDKSSPLRPHAEYIKQGGERAAAIIQDLLTLARRGVQTKEIVNLNSVIEDFHGSPEFEKLCSFHPNAKYETVLATGLLSIKGSPVHLRKTIMNLVSNAVEAMPDGGLVTIQTINQYLDRPIPGYDEIREGDYVILSVTDTGEGISESEMKRIFEPFYTKKVLGRSGTGLGLAVVWGTVKDHNGYVNVWSEAGKGTTFTLYLPVTREEAVQDETVLPKAKYLGKKESILVIDDVQGQRELAALVLKRLNYILVTVANGEEAIQYLKNNKVDLLVLDMIMEPGMDGLDTYREILKIHPKQKAIIVSGYSESDRVRQAQAIGAGAYVRKPYVQEQLGLAVRNELDRSA